MRLTYERRIHLLALGAGLPGTLVALTSSVGLFEVAVVQGSAAKRLGVKVGDPVTVGWQR